MYITYHPKTSLAREPCNWISLMNDIRCLAPTNSERQRASSEVTRTRDDTISLAVPGIVHIATAVQGVVVRVYKMQVLGPERADEE
jgi:hypothetical protein